MGPRGAIKNLSVATLKAGVESKQINASFGRKKKALVHSSILRYINFSIRAVTQILLKKK